MDLLLKVWNKWLIIDGLLISLIDWFSKYGFSKICNISDFLKAKYTIDIFFEENVVFLRKEKEKFSFNRKIWCEMIILRRAFNEIYYNWDLF